MNRTDCFDKSGFKNIFPGINTNIATDLTLV